MPSFHKLTRINFQLDKKQGIIRETNTEHNMNKKYHLKSELTLFNNY